jgi:hypothetical protein
MKLATVIATSILSFAALHAQAAAPADTHSISVQYADLNLDSKAGIVTLYRRIRALPSGSATSRHASGWRPSAATPSASSSPPRPLPLASTARC